VLGRDRLQLADQVGVAAARQVGVDALLERGEPQLVQPCDLGLRERLVGEVGERRAAPQRERLAQLLGRAGGLRPARLAAQPLEQREVQLVALHVEHVAGRARGQPLGAELAPQAHDVALDALGHGGRRRLSPQVGDQPVGRDDLVGAQQQDRQQGALLDASEHERPVLLDNLQGSEEPELHVGWTDRTERVYRRLPRATSAVYRRPRTCGP
jgi:hypothetical protein